MNMKNLRERLLRNAYFALTLVAVILILLVLTFKRDFFNADSWESIALNIATELIGVVAVFLLLNKLLIGDELRLSDRVEEFLNRLDSQDQGPPATRYFLKNPIMQLLFQDSRQVDMLGVTLSSTVGDKFSEIKEGLRRGNRYRVILADPDSVGFETAVVRSQIPDKLFYKSKIENTIKELAALSNGATEEKDPGSMEVRLLQFATSFGIKAFDSDQKHGRIFVEIYPYQTTPVPFIELIPARDGEWFPYFARQFDSFWQLAIPIENKQKD